MNLYNFVSNFNLNLIISIDINNNNVSQDNNNNSQITWEILTSKLCEKLFLSKVLYLQLYDSNGLLIIDKILNIDEFNNSTKYWINGMIYRVTGESFEYNNNNNNNNNNKNISKSKSSDINEIDVPTIKIPQVISNDFESSLQSILAGLSRLESEAEEINAPTSFTATSSSNPNSMASLKTYAEMELERQQEEEAKKRLQATEDSRRLREILEAEKRQQQQQQQSASPNSTPNKRKEIKQKNSRYSDDSNDDYNSSHGNNNNNNGIYHNTNNRSRSYSTDEERSYSVKTKYYNHNQHENRSEHDSESELYQNKQNNKQNEHLDVISDDDDDAEDREWLQAEELRAKQKARDVERQKRVQTISNQRRTLEEGSSSNNNGNINGKHSLNQSILSNESNHIGGNRLKAMGGVKLLMKKPIDISFSSIHDSKHELIKVSIEDQCDWISLTTSVGVYLNVEPTQITHFVLIDEDGDEASGKISDSIKFWKFFDRYSSVEGRSFAVHHPFVHQSQNNNNNSNNNNQNEKIYSNHSTKNHGKDTTIQNENIQPPSLLDISNKKIKSSSTTSSTTITTNSIPIVTSKSHSKTESYHFRLSTDYVDERVLIHLPSDANWKVMTDGILSHLNIPKGTREKTQLTRISLYDEDGDEIAGPFENEDKFWKAARSRYGPNTVFVVTVETLYDSFDSNNSISSSSQQQLQQLQLNNVSDNHSTNIFCCLDMNQSTKVNVSIPLDCSWNQINDIIINHFKLKGKAILKLSLIDEEDEVFGDIIEERKFWKSIKSFYKSNNMKYVIYLKDAPIPIIKPQTISLQFRLVSDKLSKSIQIPQNGTWEQILDILNNTYSLSHETIDHIDLVDSDNDIFGTFTNESKFWKAVKLTYTTQSDMIFVITTIPNPKKTSISTGSNKLSKDLKSSSISVPTINLNFRLSTADSDQNNNSSIPIPINGTWKDISDAIIHFFNELPSDSTLIQIDLKDNDGDILMGSITNDKKFWKAVKFIQNTEGIFIITIELGTKLVVKKKNEKIPSITLPFILSNLNDKQSINIDIPLNSNWETIEEVIVSTFQSLSSSSSSSSSISSSISNIENIMLLDEEGDPFFEGITNDVKFWKAANTRYQANSGMVFVVTPTKINSKKKVKSNLNLPTTPIKMRLNDNDDNNNNNENVLIPIDGTWIQISDAIIDHFSLLDQTEINHLDLIDSDGDEVTSGISTDKKFWKAVKKGYNESMIFIINYTLPINDNNNVNIENESSLLPPVPTIPIFCRLSTDDIYDKAVSNIPEEGNWNDISNSVLNSLGVQPEYIVEHFDLIDSDGDEIFGMINNEKKFWKAVNHRYNPNQMIFVATLIINEDYLNNHNINDINDFNGSNINSNTNTTTTNNNIISIPTINYSFSLNSELNDLFNIPIPENGSWEDICDSIINTYGLENQEIVSIQLVDMDGDDVFSKINDSKKFWKAATGKYIENETVFIIHLTNKIGIINEPIYSSNYINNNSNNNNNIPIVEVPQISLYKKKSNQQQSSSASASILSPITATYQSSDLDSSSRSQGSDQIQSVSLYKKKLNSNHDSNNNSNSNNNNNFKKDSNSSLPPERVADPRYAGRVVEVDCKLSNEGFDKIIPISIPAMGSWEQISSAICTSFEISNINNIVDRLDLLDNDNATIGSNIVSSSKFWKICLEQYKESETFFNVYVKPNMNNNNHNHNSNNHNNNNKQVEQPIRQNSNNIINDFLEACGNGDVDLVSEIIQKGLDINMKDESNLTGMHIACIHGQLKVVQYLVDKEASITCRDLDGMTPLHFACENNHTQIAIYLVRMGADTSLRNRAGLTSLHYICLCGNMQLTVLIRDYMINVATSSGLTLLHCAADQGHAEMLEYLIEHEAQVQPRDDEGLTPLHLSATNGHIDCVGVLLKHGAYWNVRDDSGMSALLHACNEGNLEMVKYLSSSNVGCNILARNDNGDTSLHLAAASGSLDLVKFLVSRKVDINGRNKNSETALDIAKSMNHDVIVNWLKEKGAITRPETREESITREKIDNKTETAARAFEAEEMLNLQRDLEALKKKKGK